ncbi:MAG: PEGA domain-containing protein [Bacteroidota bacterium]|jgi:hypothetical protein
MKNILQFQLLLILFLSSLLFSQQLSQMSVVGKADVQSSELVAKEVRDANGEVCAGLIIATDLDGLKFDSYNGVVKMNADKPGRYFLFLSPDERVVTVYKTGYEPLKVILSEYGISQMQSGKVWQIKVTGERKLDFIPVTILITPENATLYIDGKKGQNSKSQKMSIGKHELRIEMDGYRTENRTIEVSLNNALFNINLKEVERFPVQIHSQPSGAKIFINNIEKGETDKGLFLYAGTYQLKLSKAGCSDTEQPFTVKENGENIFSFTLEKNAGTLIISVIPEDAQVFINKEDYTGKKTLDLFPGKYRIEIQKDGYTSQSEMVDLLKSETVTRSYSLEPKTASLQFTIQPLDAQISLTHDGKNYDSWIGMKSFNKIPVGRYELNCVASGYEDITKSILIDENSPNTVDLVMNKRTSQIMSKFVSAQQQSALSFGPKFELNFANIGGDGASSLKSTTLIGFGGFVTYNVAEQITLQGELLYNQKGFKMEGTMYNVAYIATQSFSYLEVVALAKYILPVEGNIKPVVFAGPAIGILMSANTHVEAGAQSSDTDLKSSMSGVDFGLLFGAGVSIKVGNGSILFDVRYNLGLANINKTSTVSNTNQVIGFSLGYAFM